MSFLQKTNSRLQEGFHCNKLNIEMNKNQKIKKSKNDLEKLLNVYLRTHIRVRGC